MQRETYAVPVDTCLGAESIAQLVRADEPRILRVGFKTEAHALYALYEVSVRQGSLAADEALPVLVRLELQPDVDYGHSGTLSHVDALDNGSGLCLSMVHEDPPWAFHHLCWASSGRVPIAELQAATSCSASSTLHPVAS